MIHPQTNKLGLEVMTSPTTAPKSQPSLEAVVSPGRVRRLAGNITPNKSNLTSNKFFNENRNTSNINRTTSDISATSKDRYVIQSKSSTSSRIGVQHGIPTVSSNKSSALFKSASKSDNVLKPTHSYLNTSSPRVTKSSSNIMPRESFNELPSLMTNSETFDTQDDSIAETALYRKFLEAFELTMKQNPGLLPSAPSVIESVQNALYKHTQAKVNKEKTLRDQISKMKKERDQMESSLGKEMSELTLNTNDLAEKLKKMEAEKDRSEDSLRKQIDAVAAMKLDAQTRMDEATKEKEELTKHLGFLSKSRAELETALEKEMKLVEKDRDALKKVIAERKSIQKQKMENQELESKIEIMTEAATKEKVALQAEATELKSFEAHLQKLKQSNEETRKELEEEKHQLMELTKRLQAKKQAVIESKDDIERSMQAEIDELEAQIENSRLLHSKDMERLIKSKVMKYLDHESGGNCGESIDGIEEDAPDMERIIQSRVEAELKQKGVEMKERELALKEQEMRARERELQERVKGKWDRREHKRHSDDDDNTLGDDSIVQSEIRVRRSRSSRSRGRRNKYRNTNDDDDESTIASIESRAHGNRSKEANLRRELDELRKELAKKNGESEQPIRKYFSPQDELRGEIAALREEIKLNHRDSSTLRHCQHESRGYHESPGVASAPPRDYHHESPGMKSYASAPVRHHHEAERRSRSSLRRRYDDEEEEDAAAYVVGHHHNHRPTMSFDYERESCFRGGGRFSSSPGGSSLGRHRSPGPRKSKYYM